MEGLKMPSSMQSVGRYLARASRAKGYGLKHTQQRTSAGGVVPKTYTSYRTRGTAGKPRQTLAHPVMAQSRTKAAITKAMNSGKFAEIPKSGVQGVSLKNNMIQFAESVKAPPMLVSRLRRCDPDKLYALMTVNDWVIDEYFSYEEEGFDYGGAYHSSTWDNIEMVLDQYDRVFGVSLIQTVLE